ncbi:glycosyltransferase family 4 protein [Arthrobacter ramosus]|uniref:glycosyltransferase family 4 protein n=1 Tax=Arthrobacter ramosus TaxID=1672 RepID=UPI002FEABAD1
MGLGSGSTVRAVVVRRLKLLAAKAALKFVSNLADSVSYISKRDLSADEDYISPAVARFVIPNGAPIFEFTGKGKWNPIGPLVVVGDWAYPPNRQMLQETIRWYMQCLTQKDMSGLNIVGPNLVDDIQVHESINVIGWVDDITTAYSGVSAALAFVSSGAGVKNKVLEPLSFGIPVIATNEAMNGIDCDDSMVLEYRENLAVSEVDAWLAGVSKYGARAFIAPSWQQNLGPLLSHLERHK